MDLESVRMRSEAHSESLEVGGRDLQDETVRHAPPKASSHRNKMTNKVILALCTYSALRILVFAVAFPLFNNTDEKFHFMAIQMYAAGHFPGKDLPLISSEFSETFLPYFSPEYELSRESIDQSGIGVPLWRVPRGRGSQFFPSRITRPSCGSGRERQILKPRLLLFIIWSVLSGTTWGEFLVSTIGLRPTG